MIACGAAQSALAQYWPLGDLNTIVPKLKYDHMQYDYKVILENVSAAKNVDSMYGHLIVSGNRFIDSNKLCYIAKNNTQYCKLDHTDKTATIFSLAELAQKLKMPLIDDPVNVVSVSGELIGGQGNYHTIDVSSPMFYRLSVTLKDQDLSFVQLDFKKADSTLIGAYFQLRDKEEEESTGDQYRRNYYIYNIRSTVREDVFDLSRIFQMKDAHPVLSRQYTDYKLTKLMQ